MGVFYGDNEVWNAPLPADQNQTNNRAELMAALHALRTRDPSRKTVLVSDSEFFVNGYNLYMKKWARHNWTSRNSEIAHSDIWSRILHIHNKFATEITVVHVPSHIGIHGNTLADKLATQGRMKSPLWIDIPPPKKARPSPLVTQPRTRERTPSPDADLDFL